MKMWPVFLPKFTEAETSLDIVSEALEEQRRASLYESIGQGKHLLELSFEGVAENVFAQENMMESFYSDFFPFVY